MKASQRPQPPLKKTKIDGDGSQPINAHPYSSSASEESEDQQVERKMEEKLVARRVDGKKYVERGSLNEEALIKAKLQVQKKGSKTEQDKKEERRVANRLSAFQSRIRRKTIIVGLQKTVAEISKENKEKQQYLEVMSAKLSSVMTENAHLRQQLAAAVVGAVAVGNTNLPENAHLRRQLAAVTGEVAIRNANLQTNRNVGTFPDVGYHPLLFNTGIKIASPKSIQKLNVDLKAFPAQEYHPLPPHQWGQHGFG